MSDRAVGQKDFQRRLDRSRSENAQIDQIDRDREEGISADVRVRQRTCQQTGHRFRNQSRGEPGGKPSISPKIETGFWGDRGGRLRLHVTFQDPAKRATLVKLSKLAHPEVRVFPSGNPPGWKVNPNQEKEKLWQ